VTTPLAGQTAIVTGGSRGIGRAIVCQLAALGAEVFVNYVANGAAADDTIAQVTAAGGRAHPLQFDVGDATAVKTALDLVVDRQGRIDIFVNNAGLAIDGLVLRFKDDDWQRVLQTNLTGVFHCAKVAVRAMVRGRYGRIVNITSVVAEMGNSGQAPYAAAKAGVVGFSRSLAREVASRGITVNVVSPGLVETDMSAALGEGQRATYTTLIPVGRMGTPDDVASAVAFLATPAAGYITGHVLHVNGGLYM
jgi:3-oxoacyl-[acyl-carrier protein] reductase